MSEKKVMLVVASKVKALAKEQGVSVGKEGLEALSDKVHKEVLKAMEKAKADKRKTVKARDVE
tara:strand:+ start:750 stop:938 length:189 start_codon:yes stop_codon:yes gene_type:complete